MWAGNHPLPQGSLEQLTRAWHQGDAQYTSKDSTYILSSGSQHLPSKGWGGGEPSAVGEAAAPKGDGECAPEGLLPTQTAHLGRTTNYLLLL